MRDNQIPDDDRQRDADRGDQGSPSDDSPQPVPFRARMSIYLIALAFFGLLFCMCAFIFAIAATM